MTVLQTRAYPNSYSAASNPDDISQYSTSRLALTFAKIAQQMHLP